jgi:hypothetical protein
MRRVFRRPEPEQEFPRGDEDILHLNETPNDWIKIDRAGWQMAEEKDGESDTEQNDIMQQREQQHAFEKTVAC